MSTLKPLKPGFRLFSLATAVVAGYVTILSTGPVAANVRLTEIVGSKDSAFWFSILAATGALVAAVAFLLFGRLSDRLVQTRGSRQPVFIFAVVTLVPIGWLLSQVDSIPTIMVLWSLMQLPAAAILSVGTAIVLEQLPPRFIAMASSLFGVGAMLAILYGALIGTLTENDPGAVILIGSLTAFALALPAALSKEKLAKPIEVEGPAGTKYSRSFFYFLFAATASLAVSALATDYFYQLALRLTSGDTEAAAALSQALYSFSALTFLVAALGVGFGVRSGRIQRRLFEVSLLISAIGLLILAFGNTETLLVVGALTIGVGTGANIATQFPILRQLFQADAELGRPAGLFNTVGILPSFLIPGLGALLIHVAGDSWPIWLGASVAALAAAGSLLSRLKLPSEA